MTLRNVAPIALCVIGASALWKMHAQSAPAFTGAQSDGGHVAYSENLILLS
jgi:hypothetical protein